MMITNFKILKSKNKVIYNNVKYDYYDFVDKLEEDYIFYCPICSSTKMTVICNIYDVDNYLDEKDVELLIECHDCQCSLTIPINGNFQNNFNNYIKQKESHKKFEVHYNDKV